jgi:hypothetical protein
MLAIVDGFEHQLLGQGVTTDQLDNDIDLGVIDQLEGILGQADAGRVVLRLGTPAAISAPVQGGVLPV